MKATGSTNVRLLCGALAAVMLAAAGCGTGGGEQVSSQQPVEPASGTTEESASEPEEESESRAEPVETDTYLFTDSSGREVEIPRNPERIASSGPLSQVVLYTLCPDKMVGWGSEFSAMQMEYIDERYTSLPAFGNFYGDTLNMEVVAAADPQVIFDIGEVKKTTEEDMDSIQLKTGIPTVFIHMELDNMADAFRRLGELTGDTEQAENIAVWIEDAISDAREKAAAIPEEDRLTVYYGQGEGLDAEVKGTGHTDVIELIGASNVADITENLRGGVAEINMEQLMLWDPDVILFAPDCIHDTVSERPEWADLRAVKDGAYYEVPIGPYNFMGRPPSVNRIIGIKWLGNLLYPDIYQYDMVKEITEFYSLFYHCDITREQAESLIAKSTLK